MRSYVPTVEAVLAALIVLCPVSRAQSQALAQTATGPTVREHLQQQLVYYEGASESPAYSDEMRSVAGQEAARVRTRLRDGDFRIGDRVLVVVEQQSALTDTFIVSLGPALVLPGVGSVALTGVLQDELQSTVRTAVWRVYRGAVVRAQRLMRISVEGFVGRPSFYDVSAESRLDDILQLAGGPQGQAEIAKTSVYRGRDRLMAGDSVLLALRTFRTLEDLGLSDGDRIVVPQRRGVDRAERSVRTFSILLGIPLTIYSLTQIFQ
jgi:protein involved in polysaccharide export with SLBB domain